MDIRAISRRVRLSPTKARDFARAIQGKPVAEALRMTSISERKAAFQIGKTLKSAIANAENNADLDVETLWIKQAVIDEGPRMKRFWPRARGMVRHIVKKTCHITIVLTDD
jgi:large subunit ribosomal protein L22